MFSNRFFNGGIEYISAVGSVIISPLTPIAQVVMEHRYFKRMREPTQHLLQGFRQFFAGPFWSEAEQKKHGLMQSSLTAINKTLNYWRDAQNIREVLSKSLYKNVVEYILPIMLYRYTVKLIAENCVPEEYENALMIADATLMLTLFSRLFVRRLVDNTLFSTMLPRAVSNDVAKHRPKVISEELSAHLAHMFQLIFAPRDPDSATGLQEVLKKKLLDGYQIFFAPGNISEATFIKIKKPLQEILNKSICEYYNISETSNSAFEISRISANMIADEFANAFSSSYTQRLGQNVDDFKKELKKVISDQKKVAEYSFEFFHGITRTRKETEPFLPIKHLAVCKCEREKKIHAALSSSIYYAGNLFFTTAPQLALYKAGIIPSLVYEIWDWVALGVRVLIYGQSFNEYKMALDEPCTRHRYEVFMRNKMHSLGTGGAYKLMAYLITSALLKAANFDDNMLSQGLAESLRKYFISDAIANIVMQFGVVSILSFNEKLPGRKENPTDIFERTREMTRLAHEFIERAHEGIEKFFELEHKNPLQKVKSVLRSPKFNWAVDFFLSGSNFLPRPELFTFNGQHVIPAKDVFIKWPTATALLDLYRSDVEGGMARVEGIQKISNYWFIGPLLNLPLPLPRVVMSFVVKPLQMMQDKEVEDGIEGFFKSLFNYYYQPAQGYIEKLSIIDGYHPGAHVEQEVIPVVAPRVIEVHESAIAPLQDEKEALPVLPPSAALVPAVAANAMPHPLMPVPSTHALLASTLMPAMSERKTYTIQTEETHQSDDYMSAHLNHRALAFVNNRRPAPNAAADLVQRGLFSGMRKLGRLKDKISAAVDDTIGSGNTAYPKRKSG
jgi:hypothetical protein